MAADLLIFGYGYTGQAMAIQWKKYGGAEVCGTSRLDPLPQDANVRLYHLGDRDLVDLIGQVQAILLTIPPADPVLPQYGPRIAQSRAWVGYLSTTAVYGDHNGNFVNEMTPPNPQSTRARNRLSTEQAWQALCPQINIFRLAGIYGPDRNPIKKIQSGQDYKIVRPDHFMGRIHVFDVARILMGSIKAHDQGALYVLGDDVPTPSHVVYDYAAHLMGISPLRALSFDAPALSERMRTFYLENRRIDNTKIRTHFGPLLYPDYRSGLDALWHDLEKAPNR